MKIDIDKMDTYKFVVCVLAFVLIFCFIFTLQTKSVINMQNKLLTKYLDDGKTMITQPTTYTSTPASTTNKYSVYE